MSAGAGADDAAVVARGLARHFGTLRAVDGVDLVVRRGEVFGLLGANGAGKSTLLRLMIGLLEPTAGEVSALGLALPADGERLRDRLGYMPQRFALYEELSVAENLDFAAEVFGLDRAARRERTARALAELGLADRRDQLAGTLSGGWKQRLGLAAATVHRPELLVLDEPTAGVDPESRRFLWEALFVLAGAGTTVLVSTHYMDEAERCHRLAMLRDGRNAAVGRPRALAGALEGRVVELETEAPERATGLLRELPEVASVTQLGERLRVLLAAGQDAAAAAPRCAGHLRARGFAVAAAGPAAPDLEDAFVAVLRGESLGDGRDLEASA